MSPTTIKVLKYGGIILLIGIVVWLVYLMLKGGGNKYASAAAIKAGKSGADGAYDNAKRADAISAAEALLGVTHNYSPDFSDAETYTWTWFKGMNINFTAANVNKYATDIKNYYNSSFKQGDHWTNSVPVGSFLTA